MLPDMGLACQRVWFGEAELAKTAWQGCWMRLLRWVFPLHSLFGGSLVRSACFGDSRAFWRKPRTKRSFCRLDVCWRQSRVKQAPWLYVVCGAKSACVVAPPTLDVTCMAVLCSLWHTVWPNCRCGTHLRAASVAGGKCVCVIPRIWSKKARWCKFSGDGWRC